jgi:pimeloyl-ACP methyl ester carboxylesterase
VFVEINRLRHHLLDWGGDGPLVLLLHGLAEHAHVWDLVAPQIVAAGYSVLALDWRGHGDSEWIGRGGYYHFADYTADLAFLLRHLGRSAALVGHSMGGNAAATYAGTEPERVSALALIEGLGPPDCAPEDAPERFVGWLAGLDRQAERDRRSMTLDEATKRLAERFPLFSAEVARHMAVHGTREADGRRTWKFDPLHQTRTPQPYYFAQSRAFYRRIACPVLYIEGTRSYISAAPVEIDRRVAAIGAERVTIDGAGHHVHLEQPATVAKCLTDFLSRSLGP